MHWGRGGSSFSSHYQKVGFLILRMEGHHFPLTRESHGSYLWNKFSILSLLDNYISLQVKSCSIDYELFILFSPMVFLVADYGAADW